MDPYAVCKAFVKHYYNTFDSNRASLASFYQDPSMLTYEGQPFEGVQSIVAKLISLPFKKSTHTIYTIDCQRSNPTSGTLAFVSGGLQVSGDEYHFKFTQMFHLMPTSQGDFYVLNDIFRLNFV